MSLVKKPVPPPLFTLRGHEAVVTSVHSISDFTVPYLISGDLEGVIIVWDLSTFRKVLREEKLIRGKILSIRRIFHGKFHENNIKVAILVVQSREGLVKLLQLKEHTPVEGVPTMTIEESKSYPSSAILFSRGDAITINNKAYLAHTSFVEEAQITLRVLDDSLETVDSAPVKRPTKNEAESPPSCFDIQLTEMLDSGGKLLIFVGYEDGNVCVFSCTSRIIDNQPRTEDVFRRKNALEKLQVNLVRCLDTGFKEFVTSFHYSKDADLLVSGSPLNKILVCDLKLFEGDIENINVNDGPPAVEDIAIRSRQIDMQSNGVSYIRLRPDAKLLAVGLWNSQVRIYSRKSLKLLAILSNHTKQVEDIIFIHDKWMLCSRSDCNQSQDENYIMVCASGDKTISLWSLFNQ